MRTSGQTNGIAIFTCHSSINCQTRNSDLDTVKCTTRSYVTVRNTIPCSINGWPSSGKPERRIPMSIVEPILSNFHKISTFRENPVPMLKQQVREEFTNQAVESNSDGIFI